MVGHRAVLIPDVRPQLKQKSTRFKQTPLRFSAIHAIFVKLNRDPVQVRLKFLGIVDVIKRSDHQESRMTIVCI
jgi:hypothetical protein